MILPRIFRSSLVTPLTAVLGCLLLLGCDVQGTYLNRQKESIASVSTRASVLKFLGRPVSIPTAATKGQPTGVSVALPLFFGDSPIPASADKMGQDIQAILRFEVPGADGTGPTLYLCVLPMADGDLPAMQAKVIEALKKQNPKATVSEPETKTLLSPSNTPLDPMSHFSVTGEQPFLIKSGLEAALKPMPGLTDVHVVTGKEHYIVFAYRASQESANAKDLMNAIEASMRTVVVAK